MAMNKDELLDMIGSTITANGAKEITGASLNAALTAIVEAMGTSSGGGGSLLVHYYPQDATATDLSAEQKAVNAATYEAVLNAGFAHTPVPNLMVDMSMLLTVLLEQETLYQLPALSVMASEGGSGVVVIITVVNPLSGSDSLITLSFAIAADGSVCEV